MAKPLSPSTIASFSKSVGRRIPCHCSSIQQPSIKAYTTAPPLQEERQNGSAIYGNRGRELREGPRWDSTPPRMMAPVRSKPPVSNNDFVVNKDPEKLDQVYSRVLGVGGDEILTDEVKWLAVTHKSFDHGRRGYNDRLAYLGKRIVELQTSLALLHRAPATDSAPTQDQFGREPFGHPALQGLNGLTAHTKATALEKRRMARLAERYGVDGVIRWKPKRMVNLEGSGLHIVMVQALYAIVGAVALQRGGEVANNVVHQRILNPLGLQYTA